MLENIVIAFLLLPDPLWKTTLLQNLTIGSFDTGSAALKTINDKPEALTDSEIQDAVIDLFRRESSDPEWGGKAEFTQYAAYDGALAITVQKIASKRNRSDAWRALAESNYNDASLFAKWLAAQPGAFFTLFKLGQGSVPSMVEGDHKLSEPPSREQMVRANITFVLAETCYLTRQHCDQVLPLLRSRLTAKDDGLRLAAVRGLGLCGTAPDIDRLHQMEPLAPDKYWQKYFEISETQIRARIQ